MTGCSSTTTTLSAKLNDKVDMGDMYAQFTLACLSGDDNSWGVGYIVELTPKEGKSVIVRKEDFALRLEGIEPKKYGCGRIQNSGVEIAEQWTLTGSSKFMYEGLFIENNVCLIEGSQGEELMDKIEKFTSEGAPLELEAILTHKNKKVRVVAPVEDSGS